MTYYRQAFATYTDGRGRTVHTEVDDAHGRAQMEKTVVRLLENPKVVAIRVHRTNRIPGKGGSYR